MQVKEGRRSAFIRTAGALVSAGALVALTATASGALSSPRSGYPSGKLTKAQIAAAVKYVGGTGKATSGSTVKIGWINDDGGVVAYPENTAGANLSVWFANTYLGGIKGHPVALDACQANDATSAANCATKMVNDGVKVVVTGTNIYGNSSIYSTLAGAHIPVIIGNGLTPADFSPPGNGTAVTFMPGSPGVILGLAKFIGTGGLGKKPTNIAVVYTNDSGGSTAYNVLFKGDKYLKGISIKGVGVSPTATSAQVTTAVQTSGAATPGTVFVPLVPVQGCIGVYDALKTLHIDTKTTVVTTGLCFGEQLVQHVGTFPKGWYFGDYGVNYFIYKSSVAASAQTAVYIAAVHTHAPGMIYTGFAGPSFGNILSMVKIYNQVGLSASSAQLATAIHAYTGPQWGIPGALKCGFNPLLRAVCGQEMGVAQYSKAGVWTPIQDAYNGKLIDGFK